MIDPVTLTFLAETRNIGLARTVAASMAARADLPVDQLEDVRLAVDEAVAQLIVDAPEGAMVTCSFAVHGPGLEVHCSARTATGATPARDTFSWTVLSALVDDVSATCSDGEVTFVLHIARHVPAGA